MAVLSDFLCSAHGVFESMDGRCPHGCSPGFVQKIFLKAPAFNSARTTNIDNTLAALASDFGLTDMNNRGGTSAVVRPDHKEAQRREQLMGKLGDTSNAWGHMPGGQNSISQALSQAKARPDNVLSEVRDTLSPPKPMVVGNHQAQIDTSKAA